MTLLTVLDELAGNASRLHKEAVLKREVNNVDLKEAFRLAYDPYTQFYIRKIPDHKPQDFLTIGAAMQRLDLLSSRTVTGNAAINLLQEILSNLSEADAQVIARIIGKDLRCGVSEATINKIWPGLVPEYPVMLASPYEDRLIEKIHWPAQVQLKMDGMRFNAIIESGKVEFRTRNGRQVELLGNLEAEFLALAAGQDMVIDGELTVWHNGKILDRKTGNGILNKSIRGTISEKEAAMVEATVWDVINLTAFKTGLDHRPYAERFYQLQARTIPAKIHVVEYSEVENLQQAQEKFEEYFAQGEEGIILKDLSSPWENKRAKHQIKFKGELDCDLRVVDWEEGTGRNVGRLGALVLESDCGTIRVNCGSGFSDADRDSITAANARGRICTVRYNSRITDKSTGQGSLFLPRFIEFRSDKDVADDASKIK